MDRSVNIDEIGEYTYGYDDILVKDFETGERLKIGKFCSLSSNITIFLGVITQLKIFQLIHLVYYIKINLIDVLM